MALSSKRSVRGSAGADVARSDARLPHSNIVSHPVMGSRPNEAAGAEEARLAATTRNGTVTGRPDPPMFPLSRSGHKEVRLNADAAKSRSKQGSAELQRLGIGLLSS